MHQDSTFEYRYIFNLNLLPCITPYSAQKTLIITKLLPHYTFSTAITLYIKATRFFFVQFTILFVPLFYFSTDSHPSNLFFDQHTCSPLNSFPNILSAYQ